MSRVTLKDIANKTGVSATLVSKVLRNEVGSYVSKEKASEIREAAIELRYLVNRQARQLKTGRSMTIAVFISSGDDLELTVHPILIEAMASVSSSPECHYDFMYSIAYKDQKEYECLKEMLSINPDGIIYAAPTKMTGLAADKNKLHLLESAVANGTRVLFLMEKYDIDNSCYFKFDDFNGGYEGTKYLIQKGRKKIILCQSSFPERMLGYKKAMNEAGLDCENLITDVLTFKLDSSYNYFMDFFSKTPKEHLPDAIFCAGDIGALGVLNAMDKHNISQEQIEIMGYDGLNLIELTARRFPTVVQPFMQIGRECSLAMVEWINSGTIPENRLYQPVIRP